MATAIDDVQGFDAIQWAKLAPKKLSREIKEHLNEVCEKMSTFQGVLFEFIMIVFIVHHLAIIYNAERAMDLVAASDPCSADNITKVNSAAQNLILYGRVGVLLCVISLIFSRYIDSIGPNAVDYTNIGLGVVSLIMFILNLTQAGAISSEAGKCTGAAGTGNHTKALPELKTAAGNITAWSAIGLVASIGYSGFFVYKKFVIDVKHVATA